MPRKLTTEQFITKSKQFHDDKYDYSKVKYINSYTKVKIICPIDDHGEFKQTPKNHFYYGCSKCTNTKKSINNKQFLENCLKIHGDKFDYSSLIYVNCKVKVKIICKNPKHGEFLQLPNAHMNGSGCPKCANEKLKCGYKLNKALQGHYNFSGYLYKIKMFNENESFIKIGITINQNQRFKTIRTESKYNIEIIETHFFNDFNQAVIKEHKLHENYKDHSYLPKNKFGGQTECFSNEII